MDVGEVYGNPIASAGRGREQEVDQAEIFLQGVLW